MFGNYKGTYRRGFLFVLVALVLGLLLPMPAMAKNKKTIDILVFAGQSNMMGHGNAASAPAVAKKTVYAYLPVSSPGKISKFSEPFGKNENDKYINNVMGEENLATGSMVAAFAKAYNKTTKTPVLAVPCAMQGTGSYKWNETLYQAIISRTVSAKKAAKKAGYSVGRVYLVWMQGESDALAMQRNEDGTCDSTMSPEEHIKNVRSMFKKVKKKTGLSKCFVIRIPSFYGSQKDPYGEKWSNYYKLIQNAQITLCADYDDFVMAYSNTPKLGKKYLQADGMHLTQSALNKVGKAAGTATGKFALTDQP